MLHCLVHWLDIGYVISCVGGGQSFYSTCLSALCNRCGHVSELVTVDVVILYLNVTFYAYTYVEAVRLKKKAGYPIELN